MLSISTQYTGVDADHPASVEYRITVPRGANLENIRLTNGILSLDGLAGPVKATSVNGHIRAYRLGGHAELSTINGEVEAAFDHVSRASQISLSSVNGPIRLTLPAGADANMSAQNRSGGIVSNVGRVSRDERGHRLSVKGAGTQVRLRNVNGGISIYTEPPIT